LLFLDEEVVQWYSSYNRRKITEKERQHRNEKVVVLNTIV